MFKKFLFLSILVAVSSGIANAQFNTGDWKVHTCFKSDATSIVATDFGIFFVSNGYLYCYDPDTATISWYTSRNKLSDNQVTDIYYNREANYLLITYESSNIDIMSSDGSVVNLSNIADIAITSSKTINDVSFSGEDAYVATDFGYVVIDWSERRMSESNIYYTQVNSVAKVGDYIWFNGTNDGDFYSASADSSHASMSSFTKAITNWGIGNFRPVSDSTFLYRKVGSSTRLFTVSGLKCVSNEILTSSASSYLQTTSDGFMVLLSSSIVLIDQNGAVSDTITLSSDMTSSLFSSNETGVFWELSDSGVRKATVSESTLTSDDEYAQPAVSSINEPGYLLYNEDLDELFAFTLGPSVINVTYSVRSYINTLQNGVWTDVTPSYIPHYGNTKTDDKQYDIMTPFFDPDDPNTYWHGTWYDGVYKVTNGEVAAVYEDENSPMEGNSKYCIACGVQLDADHNLWVVEYSSSGANTVVLPYENQSVDYEELTEDDWITIDVDLPSATDYRASFLITKKSNIKLLSTRRTTAVFFAFDDGGDPSAGSITQKQLTYFSDQNGNSFQPSNHYVMYEDDEGKVWLGTSDGLLYFDPYEAVYDSDFRVTRPIVTDEDGSSDYLLAGKEVSCVVIDEAGYIWAGTLNDGVYQIADEGTTVVNHFTSSNSYLTADKIVGIGCKPDGSAVYIGTEYGLVEYIPNSSASESDFSNVTVSPVNVAADYTGYVVIEKLVSGAFITIKDIYGNTITTLSADGGVAQWNLCNSSGARVSTGKYYIYAATEEGGESELVGYVNALR